MVLRILGKSLKTGVVTTKYPEVEETLADGYRGLPEWQAQRCVKCGQCSAICPTEAITLTRAPLSWTIEPKKCIFCGYCVDACQPQAIQQGLQYELSEQAVQAQIHKFFGRSGHIRHLDSGSCNGCDWEMAALTGPVYDLQRFGLDFVASPRHADILMVTGPVTRNLETAVKKTYEATPAPKLVIAVGTCACSGGICRKSYASAGGVDNILPVDVYIPGCPPRPQALIAGLLKAVKR